MSDRRSTEEHEDEDDTQGHFFRPRAFFEGHEPDGPGRYIRPDAAAHDARASQDAAGDAEDPADS